MKKPLTLIVRRGALRRFDRLKRDVANLPVTVVWDRRVEERRKRPSQTRLDRRTTERRQQPSFTWEQADFVVVEALEK